MANLNFFIENGRNICENQQKLRVLGADYTYGRKNSLAPVRRSNLGSRCIAPPGGNIEKIQLCTIMAEEELETHLGTARAGPISLLMMPLLFLATAHHLVASGQ